MQRAPFDEHVQVMPRFAWRPQECFPSPHPQLTAVDVADRLEALDRLPDVGR
jgi:hypothetical protein